MRSLSDRRQIKVDKFLIKAIEHEKHKQMFPISNKYLDNVHNLRNPKKFVENNANTIKTVLYLLHRGDFKKPHKKKEKYNIAVHK